MGEYTKTFIKSHFCDLLLSVPKTIYFNFKVLPFKSAIKFPFVVSKDVKLQGVNRNSFIVNADKLPTASMRIGFGESSNARRESKSGLISIGKKGKIIVGKDLGLSQGCILIANEACITLGNHFRCSYSTTIDCYGEDITIGDDVVCGWNVTIRNGDGHRIIYNGNANPLSKTIYIDNHVWICANATVLKGTHILSDSIVAYGSLLTKTIDKERVLYGGVPAKVLREGVSWEE